MKTRSLLPHILHFFVAIGLALCLWCCNDGTTSGTETGKGISLRGRVVDKDNSPVAGVVAKLAVTGLADTTDALGRYRLERDAAALQKSAATLDTLVFLQDGYKVAAVEIDNWVDSLPDVKLTQRGFSGKLILNDTTTTIGKVEAVLTGTGIDANKPLASEFFYNKPVQEYSGFITFPNSGKEATYAVYINVYDPAGFLIGRSDTISFNGLAGNLTIPDFDPADVKLKILSDSTAAPGDTLRLKVNATGPAGFNITEYAWKLPGGDFQAVAGGSTQYVVPQPYDTGFKVILRLKNQGGATAYDTLHVRVISRVEHLIRQPWKKVADRGQPVNWQQYLAIPGISQVLVSDGKIWMFGGRENGEQVFNAWSSTDGAHWSFVADSIRHIPDVSFNNKMWAFESDPINGIARPAIRSSTDGKNWVVEKDSADFPRRSYPLATVMDGKVWIMGGSSSSHDFQDVWNSTDGLHWQLVTDSLPFAKGSPLWRRECHLITYQNQLFLITPSKAWTSPDGKSWNLISSEFTDVQLWAFAPVVYDNTLFIIASDMGDTYPSNSACYFDTRSQEFRYIDFPHPFTKRAEEAAVVFNNKVWVIGGKGEDSTSAGDVWNWGW